MRKFDSKRCGFTLVELLIVIVVIGILSAMMMLSSSEAVSSAKATAIISDMRNLKTAALAYFADNIDTYMTQGGKRDEFSTKQKTTIWDEVMVYLNGKDFPNKSSYALVTDNDGSAWYVQCCISGTHYTQVVKGSEQAAVIKKLAGRAKSVGLLADRYNASATPQVYGQEGVENNGYVYMRVQ